MTRIFQQKIPQIDINQIICIINLSLNGYQNCFYMQKTIILSATGHVCIQVFLYKLIVMFHSTQLTEIMFLVIIITSKCFVNTHLVCVHQAITTSSQLHRKPIYHWLYIILQYIYNIYNIYNMISVAFLHRRQYTIKKI